MALVIGQGTVATGMSPVVEKALYADEIFMDGVTFTSKYDIGNAGQIQVEKYTPDNSIAPKTPGSNFVDSEYSNDVVNINCNNSFQKSAKVPAYFEATMPTNVLANKTWDTTEATRVARQKAAIARIVKDCGANNKVYELTAAPTKANIKDTILAVRAKLREGNARPDVVICDVDTYTKILSAAGTEYVPMYNDDVNKTGKVGTWLGMVFIEATVLGGAALQYIDDANITQTVDTSKVKFVMYDHNALSIIDKLTLVRVIDSELFAGSKVQVEIDTGFNLTNTDCFTVAALK